MLVPQFQEGRRFIYLRIWRAGRSEGPWKARAVGGVDSVMYLGTATKSNDLKDVEVSTVKDESDCSLRVKLGVRRACELLCLCSQFPIARSDISVVAFKKSLNQDPLKNNERNPWFLVSQI